MGDKVIRCYLANLTMVINVFVQIRFIDVKYMSSDRIARIIWAKYGMFKLQSY